MPHDREPSDQDDGRDYRPNRDRHPGARSDGPASYSGEIRRGYGQREYGGREYGPRDYGSRDYGPREYGNDRYEQRDQFRARDASPSRDHQDDRYRPREEHRGGYGPDPRGDPDDRRGGEGRRLSDQERGYGRQPQGDDDDRGFIARAGDEVRSWFGDEEAERRRERDAHADDRQGSGRHDGDYHSWRQTQVAALDRDYDEYRRENSARFESEFQTWRTARQGQRDQLTRVTEHQEVLGSDGQHVGTVDKVQGDRIILTRNDKDAGGHHHSIPSRWVAAVADKVTLAKTAAEAKQAWTDEEQAMQKGRDDRDRGPTGGGNLNRSFSGTY